MTHTDSLLHHTVPDFTAPMTGGKIFQLQQFPRQYLILYFYPKDNTPGCTTEALQFRDAYSQFQQAHADIIGVSRDNLATHEKFKEKFELPFELIADETENLCNLFDVIKLKNMYGKKVHGIERTTFLIDPMRVVIQEWRSVKVADHVQQVLDCLQKDLKRASV